MLKFLNAETDDLILNEILVGEKRVDMREIHGQLDEILAGLGVVHLLSERAA